ncbi:MAG: hypothetical protein WCW44_00890 [archaeon]|jgi:hypothetical protein
MRQVLILLSLLFIFSLLNGCDEKQPPTKYFEIVTDGTSFHEIIVVPSGEVFEKIGKSNLDFENQVKTFTIQKEIAENLFNKSKELIKNGIDCEQGTKEIIIFENNTVTNKCFDSNEFDLFFKEVQKTTINQNSQNNFFIHLVTYKNNNASDMHLHSNGLLISTFYKGNKIVSATMKTIPIEKINQLKESTLDSLFTKTDNCTPFESNYNYIEIQKDANYNYYYNCQNNSMDKINYFINTTIALGG